MLRYAVVEVLGRQYVLEPKKEVLVPLINAKKLEYQVLLLAEDNSVKVGKPFLKEVLPIRVLGEQSGEKIRVSKYHAKANTRKVTGSKAKFSRIILGA